LQSTFEFLSPISGGAETINQSKLMLLICRTLKTSNNFHFLNFIDFLFHFTPRPLANQVFVFCGSRANSEHWVYLIKTTGFHFLQRFMQIRTRKCSASVFLFQLHPTSFKQQLRKWFNKRNGKQQRFSFSFSLFVSRFKLSAALSRAEKPRDFGCKFQDFKASSKLSGVGFAHIRWHGSPFSSKDFFVDGPIAISLISAKFI
jgi:hypothetical protein